MFDTIKDIFKTIKKGYTDNPEERRIMLDMTTAETRFFLKPWKVSGGLFESEALENGKKIRNQAFKTIIKALTALLIALYFVKRIDNSSGILETLLSIVIFYSIYILITRAINIAIAFLSPQILARWKNDEYPFFWLSTWIDLIHVAVRMFLIFVTTIMPFVGIYHAFKDDLISGVGITFAVMLISVLLLQGSVMVFEFISAMLVPEKWASQYHRPNYPPIPKKSEPLVTRV